MLVIKYVDLKRRSVQVFKQKVSKDRGNSLVCLIRSSFALGQALNGYHLSSAALITPNYIETEIVTLPIALQKFSQSQFQFFLNI